MRLIDADKLYSTIYHEIRPSSSSDLPEDRFEKAIIDGVLYLIDNEPAIDPKSLRPDAKWIDGGKKIKACSKCNHGIQSHMDWVNKYCPNCGAKMKLEKITS